jgi:hypothetical protein
MGCTCHPVHPAPGVGIGGASERFATGHLVNSEYNYTTVWHVSSKRWHSSFVKTRPLYKEPATTPASGPRLTDANCDANSNNHRTSCGACAALHRNKHTCGPFLAVQCRDREPTGVAMQFTYS